MAGVSLQMRQHFRQHRRETVDWSPLQGFYCPLGYQVSSVQKCGQVRKACRLREGQRNETQMATVEQCSMVFPKIEELLW